MGILPQYVIPGNPYNRCGHAEGILVGGNLSSYAAITNDNGAVDIFRLRHFLLDFCELPARVLDKCLTGLIKRQEIVLDAILALHNDRLLAVGNDGVEARYLCIARIIGFVVESA